GIPELIVFNKADLVSAEERLVLRGLEPDAIFVSARTGEGVPEVLTAIGRMLPDPAVEIDLLVPYDRGDVVSTLHETGRVLSVEYVEDGTRIRALASPEQAAQLAEFAAASVDA
ncbi:MAG TPA: GTPase HflX, partial [Agromyces sp.]|nr:GTPase HflX [Agromyces sp.]